MICVASSAFRAGCRHLSHNATPESKILQIELAPLADVSASATVTYPLLLKAKIRPNCEILIP